MTGEGTKTCLFCHLKKKAGLNILASFICCDCEKKLVNTSCEDSTYEEFLLNIKKFWHGLQSKVEQTEVRL